MLVALLDALADRGDRVSLRAGARAECLCKWCGDEDALGRVGKASVVEERYDRFEDEVGFRRLGRRRRGILLLVWLKDLVSGLDSQESSDSRHLLTDLKNRSS